MFELAGKWVRCYEVVHLETLHVTYGQSLDMTPHPEWQRNRSLKLHVEAQG